MNPHYGWIMEINDLRIRLLRFNVVNVDISTVEICHICA